MLGRCFLVPSKRSLVFLKRFKYPVNAQLQNKNLNGLIISVGRGGHGRLGSNPVEIVDSFNCTCFSFKVRGK